MGSGLRLGVVFAALKRTLWMILKVCVSGVALGVFVGPVEGDALVELGGQEKIPRKSFENYTFVLTQNSTLARGIQ